MLVPGIHRFCLWCVLIYYHRQEYCPKIMYHQKVRKVNKMVHISHSLCCTYTFLKHKKRKIDQKRFSSSLYLKDRYIFYLKSSYKSVGKYKNYISRHRTVDPLNLCELMYLKYPQIVKKTVNLKYVR